MAALSFLGRSGEDSAEVFGQWGGLEGISPFAAQQLQEPEGWRQVLLYLHGVSCVLHKTLQLCVNYSSFRYLI